MNLKNLAKSLSKNEIQVIQILKNFKEFDKIKAATSLKEVEIMRALQWLQNKGLATIKTNYREVVNLDKNGKIYKSKGLPERKILEALIDKEVSISKIYSLVNLSKEEINACIGLLRSKFAIILIKNKEIKIKLTDNGKKLLTDGLPEEKFLAKTFPLYLDELSGEEKYILDQLRKRKRILKIDLKSYKTTELTELGKEVLEKGLIPEDQRIEHLTPELLKSGQWRRKEFRRYDVLINVPQIYCGKKQPYRAFLDWVRGKLVALGFKEMDGPIVETEFWNLDALYMPQFHSARDIHDIYYVKEAFKVEIPKELISKVKAFHEAGWKYKYDVEKCKKLILRSQGTACSARMLASKDLEIPGKYFGITRCFRPDVVDATHLTDFYQVEGIVIAEKLNLRHLFGLLKLFSKEFAETSETKIVPGYFPFTEPSCEIFAKHEKLGWFELGGAGIFRPEVVKPLLGKDITVLAWGLGLDRLAMLKLGISDIRQLFSHELAFLRNAKI